MRVSSMRLKTELMFWRRNGRVIERDGYIVVETPSNPTYYGGNVLVFEDAPGEGDHERWPQLFADEFRHQPEVRHVLLGYDVRGDYAGVVEPFLEAGYVIERDVTLLADAVHPPPKLNEEIEVRPVETDAEWQSVLENHILCRHPRFALEPYTAFKKVKIIDQRRLVAEGVGTWYAAFAGEQLVADLGLFREGETARFQEVGTHPDYRRRGICGTLVYHVSKLSLEQQGISTLVMVADENYHAARIYESVGFRPRERFAWLCRFPEGQG